jgi:hypothetical protein
MIRRADLDHSHITAQISIAIQALGFTQKYGNVVGKAALGLPADVRTDKKGIQLKDPFKFRFGIRRWAFRMQVVNMDILKLSGPAAPAEGGNQTLGRTGYTA